MSSLYVDSHLRCPRDGKRMLMQVDQDDVSNRLRITHQCWDCGYREEERRRAPGGTSTAAAERLARLRNA